MLRRLRSEHGRARGGLRVLPGLVVVAFLLHGSVAAQAASLTITAPDEALEGSTVSIRYSGDASNDSPSSSPRLNMYAVPADQGEQCPDARTYRGNQLAGSGTMVPRANFDVDGSTSFNDPAVLRICATLFDSPDPEVAEVIASATKILTIRQPRLALTLSVPQGLRAPAPLDLTVTASAEVARELHAGVIPDTGAGCPGSAEALLQTPGVRAQIFESVAGGPVTLTGSARNVPAGRYLACGYVHKTISGPPQLVADPLAFVVAAGQTSGDGRGLDLRVRLARNPARVLRRGDRVKVWALVRATGKSEKNPTITITSMRGFKLRRASVGPGVRCRLTCPIDGPLGTGSPAYVVAYYLTFRGGVSRPTFSVRVNTRLGDASPANNVATMRGDRRAKPLPSGRPR